MKSFIIYTLAVIAAVAIGLWVIAMLDLDTISFLVGGASVLCLQR